MCDLAQSTSPVSVLGSQLEQLPDEHRALLKEILRLFGLVRTGLTKILVRTGLTNVIVRKISSENRVN